MRFSNKYEIISFIFISIALFCSSSAANQTEHASETATGIPFLTNISPKAYNANGQNWATVQDSNGLLYFANAGGNILQYDGVNWNAIPVGNGSIVRDIQIDSDGKIFVGMQDELGYLLADDAGIYVYKSMIGQVNCAHDEFSDIWKIGLTTDYIYFLERQHLFRMTKNSITDSSKHFQTFHSKARFHNLFQGPNNQLFVHQVDVGLMLTDADSLHLIKNGAFFKKDLLAGALPADDNKWLLVTRSRGLFLYSFDGQISPLKTSFDDLLSSSQLYHSISLSDGNIAIASKYGGLFIISSDGKLIKQINEKVGLANNTVWSVFEDMHKGLWLSLNKGLTYIDYSSPFTQINENNGLNGSVHDIIRHKGKIYITTNYGLFVSQRTKSESAALHFQKVPGINTSGWDMLSAMNSLFIVANSGIFRLSENRAEFLFKYDPWVFYQSRLDRRRIYIGLAFGVASFYVQKDGSLHDEGKIKEIDIEARTLAEDDQGNLWVASSYHGVLRASSIGKYFSSALQPTITHFNATDGLPGNMLTLLYGTQAGIRFSTPRGVYKFSDHTQRFIPDLAFSDLNQKKIENEDYMLLQSDEAGNLWSHIGQKIVKNQLSKSGNYRLVDSTFRALPHEEIQCIFNDDDQSVWFGHRNGAFIYEKNRHIPIKLPFKILIREVVLNHHLILPALESDVYNKKIPEIQYGSDNMLRFKFAATFFQRPEKTVYQYQLINFDRDWSEWASESQKDYTNLPHGQYTFLVRAKNVFGQPSESMPYSFIILPPWYHTVWAYIIFILVFFGLAVLVGRILYTYTHGRALAEYQRKEEQRRKTEEIIRSQVAADFHDELGTRITRISLFSEILKNDLTDVSDSTKGYLEKISKNAERLYDETRDFIWQLDPQKDLLVDFISRMKSFGDELYEKTDIQFEVKQHIENADTITLNMDQRRNLIRIFKEAMHNGLKHAHAKNILFEVSLQKKLILMRLDDDGIGFSSGVKSDGIGLQNMQQRAKKINAIMKIKTLPDKGTRIELRITL